MGFFYLQSKAIQSFRQSELRIKSSLKSSGAKILLCETEFLLRKT